MPETIYYKCSCGAEFRRECHTYINGGGEPDQNGHIYLAELAALQWLKLHEVCLSAAHRKEMGG